MRRRRRARRHVVRISTARNWRRGPEHLENIRTIADALQGVDVRNAAKAPNTSGTPQAFKGRFLPSTETRASRIFAVERGVVSPAFAIINVLGIIVRRAMKSSQVSAVNMAIDRALLDPDWAATLLKDNNPVNRAAMRKAAKGWMGNELNTFMSMLEPKDPDEDLKRAAMK